MSQPTPYTRLFDFTDYETVNPTEPKPGVEIDSELNAVKMTTDEIIHNLSLIQRDDGQLRNLTVTVESLSAAVRALFSTVNVRGEWLTATAYEPGDVVGDSGKGLICIEAHTSGVLATDKAAGKWIDLAGDAMNIAFTPSGSLSATNVQDAIDELNAEKQPLNAILTGLSGLSAVADRMPFCNGTNSWQMTTITAAGRELINDANAGAQRTTLQVPGLNTNNTYTGKNTFGAAINEAKGSDIASAATLNLEDATGNLVDVTGNTTVTAITLGEGHERVVRFTGALTLTHGATSIVLPGGEDIKTRAGDFATFRGYSGGVVRCVSYTRVNGIQQKGVLLRETVYTTDDTWTKPDDISYIEVEMVGGGAAGGGAAATSSSQAAAGRGGGAGAYMRIKINASSLSSTENIVVGEGGAGSAGSSGAGGEDTSFGSYTVKGGGGAGAGSAGTGDNIQQSGQGGDIPTDGDIKCGGGNGGATIRLSGSVALSGSGGDSFFGGGGRGLASTSDGEPGRGYGSGGSGACNIGTNSARPGGNGADGVVIVREYS